MNTSEITTSTTTIQDAFKAAIDKAPDDPSPRLIFADWLEEHGETERANDLRAGVRRLIAENARKAKEAREKKYAEARKDIAVALGNAYHARIEDLYSSKRGSVVYGSGGQEDEDQDAYAKSYRVCNPRTGNYFRPAAHWRNAGARVVGYARSGRIVLENHRGNEKARLPLPPTDAVFANHRGLVAGDLFLLKRRIAGQAFAVRYGVTRTKGIATGYRQTGVAVQFAVPEDCRQQGRELWSVFRTEKETYWEHGTDIAACRAEYERKLALAEKQRTRTASSNRRRELAADIAALCPGLVVTHADRKAAGYCDAGTAGFLARYNLAGRDAITAAELRATGAAEVERPIALAAQRVLAEALRVEG